MQMEIYEDDDLENLINETPVELSRQIVDDHLGMESYIFKGIKYKTSMRILVVDDEPYNIMAFLIILKIAL
jgi:spore coat polysaccharide biosynthesis predicted glycosyltransferase SpsG